MGGSGTTVQSSGMLDPTMVPLYRDSINRLLAVQRDSPVSAFTGPNPMQVQGLDPLQSWAGSMTPGLAQTSPLQAMALQGMLQLPGMAMAGPTTGTPDYSQMPDISSLFSMLGPAQTGYAPQYGGSTPIMGPTPTSPPPGGGGGGVGGGGGGGGGAGGDTGGGGGNVDQYYPPDDPDTPYREDQWPVDQGGRRVPRSPVRNQDWMGLNPPPGVPNPPPGVPNPPPGGPRVPLPLGNTGDTPNMAPAPPPSFSAFGASAPPPGGGGGFFGAGPGLPSPLGAAPSARGDDFSFGGARRGWANVNPWEGGWQYDARGNPMLGGVAYTGAMHEGSGLSGADPGTSAARRQIGQALSDPGYSGPSYAQWLQEANRVSRERIDANMTPEDWARREQVQSAGAAAYNSPEAVAARERGRRLAQGRGL